MLKEYVVNEVESNRIIFKDRGLPGDGWTNRLLDGADGGPEAIIAWGPNLEVDPHLHYVAQFHIFLKGKLKAPTYETPAIGVLYTDPGVAYGPWLTDDNLVDLVVHANESGESKETDPYAHLLKHAHIRKIINHDGRYHMVSAENVKPEAVANGITRQVLFQEPTGLSAIVYTCPPNSSLSVPASKHGRFEIVAEGSANADGKALGLYGLRFTKELAPKALKIGPQGAKVGVLTFDEQAEVVRAPEHPKH